MDSSDLFCCWINTGQTLNLFFDHQFSEPAMQPVQALYNSVHQIVDIPASEDRMSIDFA